MTPQPITIHFLSRTHEIPAYDSEGLEYRLKLGDQLELRLYRLNRGWMARLDFALPVDTYVQGTCQETAQEAADQVAEMVRPLANALFHATDFARAAYLSPLDSEPTIPIPAEMLEEALGR